MDFVPSAVSGECAASLAQDEKSIPAKMLAVLRWSAIPTRGVPESLVQVANGLPRVKRSVTKRLALKFCPGFVEAYCRAELVKKIKRPRPPFKNQEHWHAEARVLCCDSWGLSGVPAAITHDINTLTAKHAEEKSEPAAKKQRTLTPFLRTGQV